MKPADVAQLDTDAKLNGRIDRDGWVGQARAMLDERLSCVRPCPAGWSGGRVPDPCSATAAHRPPSRHSAAPRAAAP